MLSEISLRKEDEVLIADFNKLEDYDSFETIVKRIIDITNGKIAERVDGPDSRVCFLHIDSADLVLINNPYGNCLKAKTQHEILKT